MKLSLIIAPLIAAKAPHDQIMAVVMAFEQQAALAEDARLEKARARWHKWDDKRKTNVGKRQQTLANSRQQLARAEDNLLTSVDSKEDKKVSKLRGTRIPDDFEPDLDFAMGKGLSRSQAETEVSKFRNYWRAKAGANSTKLDWPATWQNWAMDAVSRLARAGPAVPKQHFSDKFQALEDFIDDRQSQDNGFPAQGTIQYLPPVSAK